MYEDLAKRLRNCASDTVEDCAGCPYQGGYKGTYCVNGLITEAADAIEELQSHYCPHAIRNVHDRGDDSLCRVLMREVPKWIPVKERLPDGDSRILVCYKLRDGQYWQSVCRFANNLHEVDEYDFPKQRRPGFCYYDDEYGWIEKTGVTHWMPLPEPPKEET